MRLNKDVLRWLFAPRWLCLLCLSASQVCLGAEAPSSEEPPSQAATKDSQWWLSTHQGVSATVGNWSNGLDAFFSGQTAASQSINQSFVSLTLGGVVSQTGNAAPFVGFRTGIRLPSTNDRLKLVIASDADKLTTDNKVQESTADSVDQAAAGKTFSAAIRYVKQEWNANLDAGVLIDFPLNPFVRARLHQGQTVGDWQFTQRETVFSYYTQGTGAKLALNATKPLNMNYSLGFNAGVTWLKQEQTYYYREDAYITHAIDDKRKLHYQFSVLQSGNPSAHLDSYLYFVQYKKLLYDNWLIGQITPQITHSEVNDFDPSVSLTLSLEVLLGEEYIGQARTH